MSNSSEASSPTLRVGLLIDSFLQPKWIAKIIEDIQSSDFARLVLVIKNEEQNQPVSRFKAYWKNRQHLLYAFYNRVDERRVRAEPDAFEVVDIRELVSDCAVLTVTPLRKKYSDWFSDADVLEIESYELDVAISFGFRILKGRALRIAKHGVWSYHHGDNLINRGGPAGFWEVLEGSPVIGSVLQVLNEDLDNGMVIYRSWTSTSDRFSVKANKNVLFWRSSSFVIKAIKELAKAGAIVRDDAQIYRPYDRKLFKTPTNAELLPKLAKLSLNYAGSKLRNALYLDQWTLAYRFRSAPDDPNSTLYRFHQVTPPKDRHWADPFPVRIDGKYYLFYEEWFFETNRGHIMVTELDPSARPETLNGEVALKRDYHLSYPFVFSWQDRFYMLPETSANSTIELYECESFPTRWKLAATLMEGVKAKDATLYEADGLWWMFASITTGAFADELHLFYAQTPLGPWTPHARNPITTDVRNLRPAGKLFTWRNQLYRPAQDGSRYYGYAVTINRVLKLTREEFVEEQVSKVLPLWRKDLLATHTLNVCDDLTVVDCWIRRRK
ncbi:MAG TPA: hypothetical protein VIR01_01990 [Pyrinomonadaceae bacterium]